MNWTIQNLINFALLVVIAFLLWANQGQGVLIASLESQLNMMKANPPKTELEICADALNGTKHPSNGGVLDYRQSIILCNASKGVAK